MTITVLIVDDHAVLRDGLRALLERETDMRVVGEAEDGYKALAEIERLKPAVAVLDVSMAGLGGIEAAQLVHERYPQVKVLMLSAVSDVESVHRALRAGAMGYLTKFSATNEIADAIRKVNAGKRHLSRSISEDLLDSYARPVQRTSPLESLSMRERQVLQLLVEGRTVPDSAALLEVSPRTIETYRERLKKKLGVKELRELIIFALKHGILPPA